MKMNEKPEILFCGFIYLYENKNYFPTAYLSVSYNHIQSSNVLILI